MAVLLTLGLAGGLGWLQLRRTAGKLNALIDGTHRWAAQDWSARVHLPAGDEFGRLGQSLNVMAERIGQQVQAMQVQAAIDREILGGLDTARVTSLVVHRLKALLPDAEVAVVIVGDGRRDWCAYRAGLAEGVPLPGVEVVAHEHVPPRPHRRGPVEAGELLGCDELLGDPSAASSPRPR